MATATDDYDKVVAENATAASVIWLAAKILDNNIPSDINEKSQKPRHEYYNKKKKVCFFICTENVLFIHNCAEK